MSNQEQNDSAMKFFDACGLGNETVDMLIEAAGLQDEVEKDPRVKKMLEEIHCEIKEMAEPFQENRLQYIRARGKSMINLLHYLIDVKERIKNKTQTPQQD